MEDMREAEQIVLEFARLIRDLWPDPPKTPKAERPGLLSTGSQKSIKASITSLWRSKGQKQEWEETTEGQLWNELEQSQSRVARRFKVDQTLLKEFISSPGMMELGREFVRHHRDRPAPVHDQAYWEAEDVFFELQAVKQGDADAGRWAEAKVRKSGWDHSDHVVRFVLLADRYRLRAGKDSWAVWEWDFATSVAFYLSILRCYTVRDAKQRAFAASASASAASASSSSAPPDGDKSSKPGPSSADRGDEDSKRQRSGADTTVDRKGKGKAKE